MTFNSGGALQLLVEVSFHSAVNFCTEVEDLFLLLILCSCAHLSAVVGRWVSKTPFLGVGIVLDHSNSAFGLVWKTRTLLVTNDDG